MPKERSLKIKQAQDNFNLEDQSWWTRQPGFVVSTYHLLTKPPKPLKRIKVDIKLKDPAPVAN